MYHILYVLLLLLSIYKYIIELYPFCIWVIYELSPIYFND